MIFQNVFAWHDGTGGSNNQRQDATDPEQKAVTDYKEQVDRNTPPRPRGPPEN